MPAQWIVVHDERLLDEVKARVDAGGVMLYGPVGMGKTELAAAVARADEHALWVVGTASSQEVPLGAFTHLIDVTGHAKTAELLRAARESLLTTGAQPLIVVDDAHLLDKLSASLVYQLASTRSARLVVTVDTDRPLPDAVAALATDGLLPRLDVAPLDREGTAAVLAAASTHPVEPSTVDTVFKASGGNPLYLRHVLEQEPVGDLTTLITAYLAALPAGAREVLNILAVRDPVPVADVVALAGEDALTQAEAAGAVRVADPDLVRPAHPLYAEVARTTSAADELRAVRTSLVQRLSAPSNLVERLRLAALALDCDAPQPVDDLVAAAQVALQLGDMGLGERLARAALRDSHEGVPEASRAGLTARLVLANALAWQGRGREADEVLDRVDPASLSDTELMAWALPRAANQFWMLGQPTQAAAFLQTTRRRVSAPAAQATLDALAAMFAMNAGTPLRALRMAEEVLDSPHADEVAVGWAASTAALSAARSGRLGVVDEFAARALAAGHPGLLRFTSGFGRVFGLVMAGRLDQARALAQRYTDFAELQQPGRAIGEVLVAYVAIAQGDFAAAVSMLDRSASALVLTGYSWGPLSLMLLAQALGQQGERIDAAKALSNAESRHGLKSALFAPELALAKAWTKAALGDSQAAIDAARQAVQAAERGGQAAVALRALQDCARLGDIQAVYRAERLAREVDCRLGRLTLVHARALVERDGEALRDVAAELATDGFAPAAADAEAQSRR